MWFSYVLIKRKLHEPCIDMIIDSELIVSLNKVSKIYLTL